MMLAQVAGLVLGIFWGGRHGFLFGVLGGLGGVFAGSVAAILTIAVVGLLAFGLAWIEERMNGGRPSGANPEAPEAPPPPP